MTFVLQGTSGDIQKLWHVRRVELGRSRRQSVVRLDVMSVCLAQQVVDPICPAMRARVGSFAGQEIAQSRAKAAQAGL